MCKYYFMILEYLNTLFVPSSLFLHAQTLNWFGIVLHHPFSTCPKTLGITGYLLATYDGAIGVCKISVINILLFNTELLSVELSNVYQLKKIPGASPGSDLELKVC